MRGVDVLVHARHVDVSPAEAPRQAVCCLGRQSDSLHPTWPASRREMHGDVDTPENRPRCASTRTRSRPLRRQRAPHQNRPPYRTSLRLGHFRDRTRNSTTIGRRRKDCQILCRSCRRERRHRRSATLLRGRRDHGGGSGWACPHDAADLRRWPAAMSAVWCTPDHGPRLPQ